MGYSSPFLHDKTYNQFISVILKSPEKPVKSFPGDFLMIFNSTDFS